MPRENSVIRIRGAAEHNLKQIDIDVPRDKLVVFTGLSGSGKSSLAFDTIYAEGQRRYVESLSAYARQFLEMMPKPMVESIDGLSPSISIEQKTTSRNPRSTVATVTEINDYMRLLWARVGTPYSPATGEPIASQSVSQMVDRTMELAAGTRLHLLAPVVRGKKGEYRKELADFLRRGFQRVRIDGQIHDLDATPALNRKVKHDIDIVVDRIIVGPKLEQRLAESFETALGLSDGLAVLDLLTSPASPASPTEPIMFSTRFACPVSGFTLPEVEPRLFSFNAPAGACPECDGLGVRLAIDPDRIVTDPGKSLRQGAIAPWSRTASPLYMQTLKTVSNAYGGDLDTPWAGLSEKIRDVILFGSGTKKLTFVFSGAGRRYQATRPFEGVVTNLERRYRETESAWVREEIGKYQSATPCAACNGFRLRPEALCVKIAGRHIGEVSALSIAEAADWFAGRNAAFTPRQTSISGPILKEICERLRFLNDVGLDYLTLSRESGSLSGGEGQRIRLASQIGSGLTGVLYVLDEPSIGLHQRDNHRLLATLKHLRDLGNSVLVVEHDEDAIRTADHVIDIGPGAGIHGGHVVAQGAPETIAAATDSLTGQYLSGALSIAVPAQRRTARGALRLVGARGNNLKHLSVDFPLGVFICVTGVSGGGKSTLAMETLYRALARHVHRASTPPEPHDRIEGADLLDKIIHIDQSPIGRTPRSNPATYTGAFGPIRDWFAGLPEAKARGYRPGRFSFNVAGGRCPACKGDGVVRIEMHFLPDVYVTCDACRGARYNRETLLITYKGRSISDVLDMSVAEAREFFAPFPAIRSRMEVLDRVGMGYVRLGQAATTLSGGEAQRVKLARELSKRATGRTFYFLDEPTMGLHFDDVRRLLAVLHELVDAGNTVLVIEHNLDVIKTADWIIDLGPDGGDGGGRIVASGPPEEVARQKDSATGQYLARALAGSTSSGRRKKKRAKGTGGAKGVGGAEGAGRKGRAGAKVLSRSRPSGS